ncbi:hypothetical protein EJ04DRAFT_444021 [Polyplosphaeria fusca]|uniref:Uncharacterized protein n=1 Tax=Polyplosphaeria fusca TaxID=682080 RepID=A0A9P4QU13_9PLEO|nr:hypothetical protein EJ04DRAFT_444021 [Polyplosphaeria fusca]
MQSLWGETDLICDESFKPPVLHPILISLLAYLLGGPVHAANTALARNWRPQVDPPNVEFLIDGDSGDQFEGHKITFAWSQQGEKFCAPAGRHCTFNTAQATPKALPVARVKDEGTVENGPVIIVHNAKDVALYYEPFDHINIRHSITLTFYLNNITNNDLIMLNIPSNTGSQLEALTLPQLVTRFPTENYAFHFHRLLFTPSNVAQIVTALEALEAPPMTIGWETSAQREKNDAFAARYQAWADSNRAAIPRNLKTHLPWLLTRTYNDADAFQNQLTARLACEAHAPMGVSFFPQTPEEEMREGARMYIRDMPAQWIFDRLERYIGRILQRMPLQEGHLLSTKQMREIGEDIEKKCLELVAGGYVDETEVLYSMPALARMLGEELDGVKERDANNRHEVLVEYVDTLCFRARCAYLFWCADWLANYLQQPREGGMMIGRMSEQDRDEEERWWKRVAMALLKSHVAFGMVIEGLPQMPVVINDQASI